MGKPQLRCEECADNERCAARIAATRFGDTLGVVGMRLAWLELGPLGSWSARNDGVRDDGLNERLRKSCAGGRSSVVGDVVCDRHVIGALGPLVLPLDELEEPVVVVRFSIERPLLLIEEKVS